MMHLNEQEIQYGFTHLKNLPKYRFIVQVSEYQNEEEITVNCTQLSEAFSAKDKKRIVNEWCDFLQNNPHQFKALNFGTRTPQELLDAIAYQVDLEKLRIKWGSYHDLSPLTKLKKLKYLELGSGSRVESIIPICQLDQLIALSMENFQKISDYSKISQLQNLESLTIVGDGLGPQYIKIDTLDFLSEITSLRFLKLITVRLQSKDYSPILALKNLEYLSIPSDRTGKKYYEQLTLLPKLKWGLLKESPALFTK